MTEMEAFEPIEDLVLGEVVPMNVSRGGIAVAGEAVDPNWPWRMKVLKCGPGRHTDYGYLPERGFCVGDVVRGKCTYYEPIPIELDGKTYHLCRIRDIVGIEKQ